jgi:hypothetical protein
MRKKLKTILRVLDSVKDKCTKEDIMSKTKFSIHVTVLLLLVCSTFIVPVQAGKVTLGPSSIKSGYNNYYFPSDNADGFRITKGTSARVKFTLKTSEANVVFGLCKDKASKPSYSYSFKKAAKAADKSTVSSASKDWSVGSTSRYKVFITNNTASTINVKNTSYISY